VVGNFDIHQIQNHKWIADRKTMEQVGRKLFAEIDYDNFKNWVSELPTQQAKCNAYADKPFTLDRAKLDQVHPPPPTLSWTPLPHHELMGRVEKKIGDYGYPISHSHCLLSHGGDRFFGSVTLESRKSLGYHRMIGVRNSHDKTKAARLIAGVRVIVCSNGMFTGDEVCLSRKHTSHLFDDLDEKIEAGFEKVFSEWERNDLRIVNYREKELSDADAHDLVVRSMDADAVTPSVLPRVLKEYRELARNSCLGSHGASTTRLRKS
jgi:hypothetical protein